MLASMGEFLSADHVELEELGYIGAGSEGLIPRTSQHYDTDLAVILHLDKRSGEFDDRFYVEGIHLLGFIDRHTADSVTLFND